MEKVDLKKDMKHLYNPSGKEISLVDVPAMNFVMIDGHGDPNTSKEYQEAIEALYGLAYTLKFTVKKGAGMDFAVMPLEGLWWTDDMSLFDTNDKSNWKWTAMIMQPEFITQNLFDAAIEQVKKKKDLPGLSRARLKNFKEGRAAQILYIGPYSAEGPTILRIHEFIKSQGYKFNGLKQKHHEIYLGDPRKAAPEKLKTVIRQPFIQDK